MLPSSDYLSQRRGSAASSVSVTIETTTTSAPGDAVEPVPPCTVEPFAGSSPCRPPPLTLPPAPIVVAAEDAPVYRFPPPYSPPSTSLPAAAPPSFFSFSALTPVTYSFPPVDLPNDEGTTPMPAAPPSYQETPRTAAERAFWWGFICPFVWLAGVLRLWRSERPPGFAGEKAPSVDLEAQVEMAQALEEGCAWSAHPALGGRRGSGTPSVEESMMLWRKEEKLWAERCAWCFGAFCALAVLAGVISASVLGRL
ncbi:hypothetical protein JCM10207_002189 [Rhodosporidiobolus poonsookiae]